MNQNNEYPDIYDRLYREGGELMIEKILANNIAPFSAPQMRAMLDEQRTAFFAHLRRRPSTMRFQDWLEIYCQDNDPAHILASGAMNIGLTLSVARNWGIEHVI